MSEITEDSTQKRSGEYDHYQIISTIGKGSYGVVQKAYDLKNNRYVALKSIEIQNDWINILSEINFVVDINHDAVVQYYNWFIRDNKIYIAMEYCECGSVLDIIDVLGHGLNEKQISAIMYFVVHSIDYLHQNNKIHRDIKCANLLITSEGMVKLCDFGVSAQLDGKLNKATTLVGSPYWMSPEVVSITGTDGYTNKVDIWSIGITAMECFYRRPPNHDIPPMQYVVKLKKMGAPSPPDNSSPEFKDFIKKCLTVNVDERASSRELVSHPFLNRDSKEGHKATVKELVDIYLAKKAQMEESCEEESVEEDIEEEEDSEIDQNTVNKIINTFLPNQSIETKEDNCGTVIQTRSTDQESGTMIVTSEQASDQSGTMIITKDDNAKKIANYEPVYEEPSPPQHTMSNSNKLRNLSAENLMYVLRMYRSDCIQKIGENNCIKSKLIKEYDAFRTQIIETLRGKGQNVTDDYSVISDFD